MKQEANKSFLKSKGIKSMVDFVKKTPSSSSSSSTSNSTGCRIDPSKLDKEALEQQFITLQMRLASAQTLKNQILTRFHEIGLLTQYNIDSSIYESIPTLDDLVKVINKKLVSKLEYLIHLNIQYEKKILTNQSTALFTTLQRHILDQNKLLEKFDKQTTKYNSHSLKRYTSAVDDIKKTISENSTKLTTIDSISTTEAVKFCLDSGLDASSSSSKKNSMKYKLTPVEQFQLIMLEEMFKSTMLQNLRAKNQNQTTSLEPIANSANKFPSEENLEALSSLEQIEKISKDQLMKYFNFYNLNNKSLSFQEMKEYLIQFLGVGVLD
ncbi:uncharacterized protein RJT21DRAFT_396 [Scheffersomyces amazonensis]|uniref:uncharacterized protein n=1 Tax=Scheffersomyces amazonensis TaxID=1078765 RepID=UPI00315D620D